MANKLLHELLQEDQEPFLLKKYIADRHLQLKKRKPISTNSNFPSNFCKNACFFTLHDSPDSKKSPLFKFPSPAKSPSENTPNAIFLHVPARTATLLLEAALKIQKQSKTKHNGTGSSFGFFGSILKKLTHRNRNRNRNILKWDPNVSRDNPSQKNMSSLEDKNGTYEMGFSCSYNGRPSSAVWSESNEEKSLDTSCSCSQSEDFEEIFMSKDVLGNNCDSPCHFQLQRTSFSGHRMPLFCSPATSPGRHQKQDKGSYEVDSLKKLQAEEEKEQCSPVSVLDPPFEDDDDRHVIDDDNENNSFECSYAVVQRTKQQLLHKLRRFEKLAGLDPVELEKRMLDQNDDDDDNDNEIYGVEEVDEFENESVSFVKSSFENLRHVPEGMKRLVTDLIAEEETEQNGYVDREEVTKRVCKRLESWMEVESNTIDMMVEQDLRKELDGWKINQSRIRETVLDVEYAIFGLLMEELSEELVS